MSWHPNPLTPAQLEQRRVAAGRLLRAGRLTQAERARAFDVSPATASHGRTSCGRRTRICGPPTVRSADAHTRRTDVPRDPTR